MSIDTWGRRASQGVQGATEGVDVVAQLTDLRRQDRARRRDGRIVALGAVVLVVAGAGWAVSSVARDGAAVIPGSPSTSAGPTPQLLDYTTGGGPGIVITDPDQVDRLTGAPDDFKAFVAGTVADLNRDDSCPAAASGVTVQKVRTDGFAVGGVNSCGGYAALWADVDGTWKEIEGVQDLWDCAVLTRYAVPSDLVGSSCYDYSGDHKVHSYHQP